MTNNKFKSYTESMNYIKKYNLKNFKDWRKFCEREDFPLNIPKSPHQTYKDKGWKGWDHFLGKTDN